MRILITGNMGYIGPTVVRQLRKSHTGATIIGIDTGFFANCLSNAEYFPECALNAQYFCDVRSLPPALMDGVDAVIHLAAISNEPMGNAFEKPTYDVNHHASVNLARAAKKAGVKNFVFASSCSIYGAADDAFRTEDSPLHPLTAYAKSKIMTENDLEQLADNQFTVTSLRFPTACGMSERLRLDMVLNDFVACAVTSKRITVLSDGTPWRPVVDVKDMARAMAWALERDSKDGGVFLAVNVGSDELNHQVKDLAEAVAKVIPGVGVSINRDAPPDRRSYRVSFALYKKLAPARYQPKVDLPTTITELRDGLTAMAFVDENFRESRFIRLNVLRELRAKGLLSEDLYWNFAR